VSSALKIGFSVQKMAFKATNLCKTAKNAFGKLLTPLEHNLPLHLLSILFIHKSINQPAFLCVI
jgi:hypothetical protein